MSALSVWLDRSLGRRIGAMVALLLILCCGALVAVSYLQVQRVSQRNTAERLRLLSSQFSELLGRSPATAVTELNQIAADEGVVRLLSGNGTPSSPPPRTLQNLRGNTRRVISVVTPDGRTVLVKGSQLQPGWFGPEPEGTLERNPGAGPEVTPYSRLGDSTFYYDIRVPVRSSGATIGMLVQRVRVTGSTEGRVAITNLLGASTSLMIGDPGTGVWTDLAGPTSSPPDEALVPGTLNHFSADSIAYVGYAIPVANTSWTLVVRTPQSTMTEPARSFLRSALLFAGIAIGLGVLGAILLGRRINRPLREITEATERIAAGNFSGRADEKSPGEVGRLARSFNAMANELGASTQRIQESEASHRAFVSHASQGIWRLEFPGGTDINRPAEAQIKSWYDVNALADCNPVLAEMLDCRPATPWSRYR